MGLPGGVVIRSMQIDDLNAVFKLGESLFHNKKEKRRSWNEQNLVETIAHEIELSFVAVRKKQLLGFLIAYRENGDKPAGVIRWLGVREDFKNSEIETGMIKSFMKSAVSRKAGMLKVEIDADDMHHLEIFQKFGFTEIRDKISMQLDL
jgi:hypothetical protein